MGPSNMRIAHVTPRYLPAQLRGGEQYVQTLVENHSAKDSAAVLTSNAIDLRGNLGVLGNFYLPERSTTVDDTTVLRFPVVPLVSTALKKIEKRATRLGLSNEFSPFDHCHVFGWGPLTPSMYWHILLSDYDVVHAAIWPTTTLYLSYLACKRCAKPFLVTPFYHFRLREFNTSSLLRKVVRSASAVIAVTEIEQKELMRLGARADRTFVVPLSINLSRLPSTNAEAFRNEYGLEGKFIVLAHPWRGKGFDLVLAAMKELSKSHSDMALVTLGQPDEGCLRELSEIEPSTLSVVNLGWVYGQRKYDAFAACDVFAMPSTSDAFGMAYLEAWALRKPVIGARNTAAEAIITDTKDGLLVDVENVQDIEAKLAAAMADREMLLEMGRLGRLHLEKCYIPSITIARFEDAVKRASELNA